MRRAYAVRARGLPVDEPTHVPSGSVRVVGWTRVVSCACVVATLVVTVVPWRDVSDDARPSVPAAPASSVPGAQSGPAAVLAAWDRSRAAAWAEGDVGALARLYVDGSRTGA